MSKSLKDTVWWYNWIRFWDAKLEILVSFNLFSLHTKQWLNLTNSRTDCRIWR